MRKHYEEERSIKELDLRKQKVMTDIDLSFFLD